MGRLGELWRRVVQWFRRDALARDLEAEMGFHLEMAAAEQRENGVPNEDAAYLARRQFGNITRLRESSVEAWAGRPSSNLPATSTTRFERWPGGRPSPQSRWPRSGWASAARSPWSS